MSKRTGYLDTAVFSRQFLFLVAFSSLACVQASLNAQITPRKPSFAVASVRENKTSSAGTSNIPLNRGSANSHTGGLFRATNQPFIGYLIFAYKVSVSETLDGLMRSLPKWAVSDRFDIEAKAEDPNVSEDDLRLMVQSLLEERFALITHREVREGPVYKLIQSRSGRTGRQLQKHDPSSSCNASPQVDAARAPLEVLLGTWPTTCDDGVEFRSSKDRLRTGGRDMAMNDIASWLTGAGDLDRPILNSSGLAGNYDFILEFTPDLPEGTPSLTPNPVAEGPSFFQALEDQLGLRLTKGRGRSTVFIVDTVKYPTAN